MSAAGMTATVMALQLAEAVAKDETPEEGGCDISAGMLGPHASALLREWAALIAGEQKTFDQWWAAKEARGYRYGRDALEQVRFGFQGARGFA